MLGSVYLYYLFYLQSCDYYYIIWILLLHMNQPPINFYLYIAKLIIAQK